MLLAFEPVSAEYDVAREEYRQGLESLNNGRDPGLGKAYFTLCVSMLRYLYSKGEVENIDTLPLPHDLCWFDRKDLKGLAKRLGRFYFPKSA